jgi:hypothetical protein
MARLVQNMLSPPREWSEHGQILKLQLFFRHELSIIIIIAFFIPLHDHVRNTSRYGLSLKSKGSMDKVAGP